MTRKKTIVSISIIVFLFITFMVTIGIIHYNNKISFTINDTLEDGQGKKARVILLGGQSNAAGCSSNEYLEQNVSNEKYLEYQNGYDNIYINYYVTGRNESNGFVKTSTNQGEPGGYFGPEVGLSETLNNLYPDEHFFIIKYTWSATSIYLHWNSPSSDGKTGEQYRAFIQYINQNIKYLQSKNYDVSIEGLLWMQGESDAYPIEVADSYKNKLSNFIKDVRKKFKNYASEDGIAFIDAYIANNPMYWVYCEKINQAKKEIAESSPLNVVIDTNTHNLECDKEPINSPDIPHYDSLSELKLGRLFAEQLIQFF